MFSDMRTNSFFPTNVSKGPEEDELNLLLITEGEKKHYVLIKGFNSLMYNKTKHKNRNNFCMRCLQCPRTKEIRKKELNYDWLKVPVV